MLREDGFGPFGEGPRTGRGRGGGGGRGRSGGFGAGPGGDCVCTSFGFKLAHKKGMHCFQMKCPKCSAMMSRERVSVLND